MLFEETVQYTDISVIICGIQPFFLLFFRWGVFLDEYRLSLDIVANKYGYSRSLHSNIL
jgi:hypothetical protein